MDTGRAGPDGRAAAALLLAEFLREFAHDVGRRMEPVLRGCGLVSILQVAVLKLLQRSGPMRLTDLSRRIEVPASTLSELTERLVADGLVTRVPNPEDRRSAVLAISAQGERTLAGVMAGAALHVEGLLRRMDDTGVDCLVAGVRGLRAAVAAERAEAEAGGGG